VSEILFLNRQQVTSLLDLAELHDALAEAFCSLSSGNASVPPRTAALGPKGLLAAMPGYLKESGLAAKLVSVFPGNHDRGLPSHQALICLFDSGSGAPLSVMDGTYITAVRTAAASAVASVALARPDSHVLAILGAGVQGHSHLDAFTRVPRFDEIRVASRSFEHAAELAERHDRARAVASFEEAVRGADVVCCCTDSDDAVTSSSWLIPGAHVSSVGIGAEVDPETVSRAHVFVEWLGAVTSAPPAGAPELQGIDPQSVTEVGQVLLGRRPGRLNNDEITLYKSTGHAVEDVAAASIVYARARKSGVGTIVTL
jgi:alanine dehydrogenase